MTSTPGDPRPAPPDLPTGRLVLRGPPRVEPDEAAGGLLVTAVPMLGGLGSVALVATVDRDGGRGLVAAGTFLLATLGFVVLQLDRQRRLRARRRAGARAAYLRHLAEMRALARGAARRQRRALTWRHPAPAALPTLAAERTRVWERGSDDPDFLRVRYGVCAQPLALDLVPPEPSSGEEPDPAAAAALRRFLAAHRLVPSLPACVDLRGTDRVALRGPQEPARSLARALICSAAAFHPPEHLAVAVLCPPQRLADWDWLKWLPHALSPRRCDALGPRRMVSASPTDLADLLPENSAAAPHLLLVVDRGAGAPSTLNGGRDHRGGLTLVEVAATRDPGGAARRGIEIDACVRTGGETSTETSADACSIATAEAFARRLSPMRAPAGGGGEPSPAYLAIAAFDPARGWRPRPERDRLRVPIGRDERGGPVQLDLKEAARRGMGPHGLVIGATGSGKSELLRTLVLELATTHAPTQLALVLVDFKGGATFAGMSAMPHVAALITNLEQDLALVDRMRDALQGELVRRQRLLRDHGGFVSVHDYELARERGADLPPLPALLIVVDEFSEMLAAKPELLDLFVAIGRLGRSLGLHLLLAAQRLDEGRLRGLESHLSYRICLRTFSAAESRAVLGAPDAYELAAEPGLGYLRSDPTTMRRFRATYVSGPPPPPAPEQREETILPFTISPVSPQLGDPPADSLVESPAPADSLFAVAVRRMTGHGPAARRLWLPPLDRPETLDRLHAGQPSGHHALAVPVGTVDRPRDQRRETLTLELAGAGGHVAVVGAPRSGKSTLLRTIVASLSLTTSPAESQFFVLDFGGGAFAPFAGLPHVAAVGTRAEPDVVGRIVGELRALLNRREDRFRAEGIDSIETYRSRGTVAVDGYGEVFLVIDGWSTLRAEFEDLETEIQQLATRGLTYGLHVVIGAVRWADFRTPMRDLMGTRLELRLGDPLDSEIDRRLAATVPPGRPGRGLVSERLHFLAALPRVDGVRAVESLARGTDDLVARLRAAWPDSTAPRLRMLPRRVPLEDLCELASVADRRLLLGVTEHDLGPVSLDVDVEPHLLVFGDGGAGKTSLLRAYAAEVARTRSPDAAQLVVVDYRRTLLGEVPNEYLLEHLASAARTQAALVELAAYLRGRLPGPEVTPRQLRARSWWTGAEVFVLVDDHDLVAPATQHGSPLDPLVPLLSQSRDIGLHLVLTRRAGGASRALYEPVIQSLCDLAAPGLLLDGDPNEGPLLGGQRPRPAPPGRGRLICRGRGVEVVQVGYREAAL